MKWVTRSFPAVDRTASAWLIKRFIDPEAEFTFIRWPEEKPGPEHGIPFDIEGVELGHHDGKCTFEVIVEKYGITDPYVREIAEIVHAADIRGELGKRPEAKLAKLIFDGLRLATRDDRETLEVGMRIWDAIYAALRRREVEEKHRSELEGLTRNEKLERLRAIMRTLLESLAESPGARNVS